MEFLVRNDDMKTPKRFIFILPLYLENSRLQFGQLGTWAGRWHKEVLLAANYTKNVWENKQKLLRFVSGGCDSLVKIWREGEDGR